MKAVPVGPIAPTPLTYAAVTPARDEEQNLARLGEAMVNQTMAPVRWVIVENGSSDRTLEVARGLEAQHSFIRVINTPPASGYVRTVAEHAFQAGVDALDDLGDLVVKLDADVSVDPDYFQRLAGAFSTHPDLGIASGVMVEQCGGVWEEVPLFDDHCWGPTRAYRRSCLEVVLPLEDGHNWTNVDETKAHLAGFTTRALRDLRFRHHRPEGAGEGSRWKNWRTQGLASHHMRYRPSYVLARLVVRFRTEPQALALLAGYAEGFLRQAPRYHDPHVLDALRERQRIRRLPAAVRGRRRHGEEGHLG
jgi:poly-beta-1,6-N-acetyl-D-glucosamine synthase